MPLMNDTNRTQQLAQTIADRVNQALKAKGLSKLEFADKMNVQPSVVSRILSGEQNCTLETIAKIEEALGIALMETTQFVKLREYLGNSYRLVDDELKRLDVMIIALAHKEAFEAIKDQNKERHRLEGLKNYLQAIFNNFPDLKPDKL